MLQKAVEGREELFKRQLLDHKRQRERLILLNHQLTNELKELKGDGKGNAVNYEKENFELRDEVERLKKKIIMMMPENSDDPEVARRLIDINTEKQLVKKENDYLVKKDFQNIESTKTLNDKIHKLQDMVEDLSEQNEKYLNELLVLREKTQTEAYKLMHEQLNRQKLIHHVGLLFKLRKTSWMFETTL